ITVADQFAVKAHVAEFVDDDGDASAFRLGDEVADQRRLAGPEEAGDDGGGNTLRRRRNGAHRMTSGVCGRGFRTVGMPAATRTTVSAAAATCWLRTPRASA